MPHQLLYHSQVRAAFKQVCGVGMAECVGMYTRWERSFDTVLANLFLNTALAQATSESIEKQGHAAALACQPRTAISQVQRNRVLCRLAHEYDSLLRSLAPNANLSRGEVEVGYA